MKVDCVLFRLWYHSVCLLQSTIVSERRKVVYEMAARQTSIQVRNLIVKDIQEGFAQREVATKYRVSKTQVQKLWKKFMETGSADRVGRGRNRVTTDRDDSHIVQEVKKNPYITIRAIQENLQLQVSHKTIRRRLKEANLHSHYSAKRPFINKRNRI